LYAALFAAIGSAVDSEADTQQFMLPVTIPLILSMMLLPSVMNDPNGMIAQVFSLIPFTSPIVMMMRIPFGVSPMTFALSAVLLIGTWLLLVWFAGRIYRTGILMYGKKITYRELFRWLRYKSY
jgi:ABC-2 type transport system permease protein